MSDKRILPLFLLFFFLAWLGVHRFYAGKIGTGILFILTLDGLGIWWIIDLILHRDRQFQRQGEAENHAVDLRAWMKNGGERAGGPVPYRADFPYRL